MTGRSARSAFEGARSRVRRLRQKRLRRRTVVLAIVATIVLAGAGAAYAVLAPGLHPIASAASSKLSAEAPLPAASLTSADGSSSVAATAAVEESSGVDVEVPNVVGKSVKVAEAVLSGAGFVVQTRVADPPTTGVTPDTVVEQWPSAGALVEQDSPVVLTYQPRSGAGATADAPVVVIDAGHQRDPNLGLEPIGPGSKTSKAKVAGGATGVSTQATEYHRDLELALKLRAALVAQGMKVVMVRTTDDVDIANSRRAEIGNQAGADLVVRIHLDASTDTTKRGVSTLYPSGNAWVKPIESKSHAAAEAIESALSWATGSPALGVFGRSDMSGFNFSKRPVVMVLCGFLSNAAEDEQLALPAYQAKVVSGIAAGIDAYLESR